jgi:ABC-type proline/glycine betaine transport system permease subunit
MRDWVADWRKWSTAERALAIALVASMMAVPVGMLLGITHPV